MLPKGGRLQTEAINKQKQLGTQTRYGKWLAHMIKSPFRSQKQQQKKKTKTNTQKNKTSEKKRKRKRERKTANSGAIETQAQERSLKLKNHWGRNDL